MDASGYTIIEGTVQSVVFQNPENGYTVLRLRMDGRVVTCVGIIPGVAVGEGLTLTGVWTAHQSYGEQFKAEAAERSLPRDAAAIYEYLASGVIKGVGARTARLIVEKFGSDTLRIIEEEPERLSEVKGITPKKAEDIGRRFERQEGLRRLIDFLVGNGVRPYAAARLYRLYGTDAQDEVMRNPYILTDEYIGLDFFEADDFALKLGFGGDSPERIEAAVLFEMRHNLGNGHVFLPKDKLTAAAAQLINVETNAVRDAVADLTDGGYIVEDTVAGVNACYLDDMYRAETYVASRLSQMVTLKRAEVKSLDKLTREAEIKCGVEYAENQLLAIKTAAKSGAMVLTGGPGTGKTTAVRGILEVFDSMGLETLLTAPTGRAAKRLSELTGREAQTIHRLLGAGMPDIEGEGRIFEKCASDQLDCDAVILDETSMVDIGLMSALLEAMPLNARIIMVGDADQLASVGPGNVFADIIRSGAVPVVSLNEIFRQAKESMIVRNAHMINFGEVPELVNRGGDFFFLQRTDERITQTVTELVSRRLPEKMGIPMTEIQVLSPSKKNAAGTWDLNVKIQESVNPAADGKKEKVVGSVTFRVGDRVMQTRNNYDILWYRYGTPFGEDEDEEVITEPGAGVFNGDVGYIEDIDERQAYARIRFEDRVVPYPFEMMGDLELAYAMTVHKSQGSEYRAVVLAVNNAAPMLKARSVLYTAVTRAKELLVVVGDGNTFAEMVNNDRRQRRYSGLRARLAGEV